MNECLQSDFYYELVVVQEDTALWKERNGWVHITQKARDNLSFNIHPRFTHLSSWISTSKLIKTALATQGGVTHRYSTLTSETNESDARQIKKRASRARERVKKNARFYNYVSPSILSCSTCILPPRHSNETRNRDKVQACEPMRTMRGGVFALEHSSV